MTEEKFQAMYSVRSLKDAECAKDFDCGDEDLNEFITQEAALYKEALLAVSYIVEDKSCKNKVAAYFSLANDKVSLAEFKSNSEFNRFRKRKFINQKRLKSYPAVKLCRFGVNRTDRRAGIGSYLLDFIKTLFVTNNRTGCCFLTVDVYKEAVPFYLKNGFIPLTAKNSDSYTELLYYDLYAAKDIE